MAGTGGAFVTILSTLFPHFFHTLCAYELFSTLTVAHALIDLPAIFATINYPMLQREARVLNSVERAAFEDPANRCKEHAKLSIFVDHLGIRRCKQCRWPSRYRLMLLRRSVPTRQSL